MFSKLVLPSTIAMVVSTSVLANQELQKVSFIEETLVIGHESRAQQMSSSAEVISEADLERFHARDINKIILDAPGVYAAAEEGWGLRPNIGIRGSGASRSSKIMVLEDGIMASPAPYSNPDAYYFPTASRMVGVEVLKGAPILEYGPSTVGGVLNLVSVQIPEQGTEGGVTAELGSFGTKRGLVNYGFNSDNVGFVIEGQRFQSDGFHKVDRSDNEGGFEKNDFTAKLTLRSDAASELQQSLNIKYQYADESSDMSYFGVSDADFNADSNRRYGISDLDNMDNDRNSAVVNYTLAFENGLQLSATAYRNEYNRDWFKLDKINGVGGSSLFDEINFGGANAALYQGWVDGTTDVDNIQIKHNNRSYVSEGVQLQVSYDFSLAGMDHSLRAGIRDHDDSMDRFQPVETYRQVNGQLEFVSSTHGAVTGSNNRYETGEGLAFWLADEIQLTQDLNLTLVARHEDMEVSRKTYSDNDRQNPPAQTSNAASELLLGASFAYQLDEHWMLLGGVQEGMTPLSGGSTPPDAPEKAVNYEFGSRYVSEGFSASVIGFYSDYSNTVQYCSNAYPCDNGDTQGAYSLGESVVKGIELSADATHQLGAFVVPVHLAYTLTDAEVTEGPGGSASVAGDEWAYVAPHQLSATVGLESAGGMWGTYLRASYASASCTETGCNRTGEAFKQTDSITSIDWANHYAINDQLDVYLNVENMLNDASIVSRSPYGARGNMPRSFTLGVDYKF